MSEQPDSSDSMSDEELLADAIPIDVNATDANDGTDHDAEELTPIDMDEQASSVVGSNKIRTFDPGRKPHDENWKRTPNVTGAGAINDPKKSKKPRNLGE